MQLRYAYNFGPRHDVRSAIRCASGQCRHTAGAPRGAFTLLESLLVIVIVSTAFSVVAVGLGRADASARLRALQHALQDLDSAARLHARVSGSMILLCWPTHEHPGTLIIDANPATTPTLPGHTQLLPGSGLHIDPPELLSGLTIDALGRSRDYALTLEHGQGRAAWRVCGLTGAIVDTPEGQP